MLVTKSKFAELAGVSPKSITWAIKTGTKPLAPAVLSGKIDPHHPAALAYINHIAEKKGLPVPPRYEPSVAPEPTAAAPEPTASTPRQKVPQSMAKAKGTDAHYSIAELIKNIQREKDGTAQFEVVRSYVHKIMIRHLPDDIRKLSGMSLDDLITIFGTDVSFTKYLDAVKKIEDIFKNRISNATALGELVSKELVKKGIIAPIDGFHRGLLTDGTKTIEQKLRTLHDLGKPKEECEIALEKIMTRFLKPMKSSVAKGIQKLDTK